MSDTTRRVSVPALDLWAPLWLAILRIVTTLLFLDHGLMKLLHFRELGLPEMLRVATGLVEMFGTVFFYLVFAGPGAWSLDATIHDR